MLKYISSIATISLFLGIASSRFLQSTSQNIQTSVNFATDLKCGDCVLGNFTYCVKGSGGQFVSTEPTGGVCCKNDSVSSCPFVTNVQYTCTSKSDTVMTRLKVCPFITSICGTERNFSLLNFDDQSCNRVNNFVKGNVCFYTVKSRCQIPRMKFNSTNTTQYMLNQVSTLNFTASDSCECNLQTYKGTNYQYLNCTCQLAPENTLNNTWSCAKGFLNQTAGITGYQCNATKNCYCNDVYDTKTKLYLYSDCNCTRRPDSTKNFTYQCSQWNETIMGNNSLKCVATIPNCDCNCTDPYCFTQKCACKASPINTTAENYFCNPVLNGKILLYYDCNYTKNEVCNVVIGTQTEVMLDNFTQSINYKAACSIVPKNTSTQLFTNCTILQSPQQTNTSWTGRDLAINATCNSQVIQPEGCLVTQIFNATKTGSIQQANCTQLPSPDLYGATTFNCTKVIINSTTRSFIQMCNVTSNCITYNFSYTVLKTNEVQAFNMSNCSNMPVNKTTEIYRNCKPILFTGSKVVSIYNCNYTVPSCNCTIVNNRNSCVCNAEPVSTMLNSYSCKTTYNKLSLYQQYVSQCNVTTKLCVFYNVTIKNSDGTSTTQTRTNCSMKPQSDQNTTYTCAQDVEVSNNNMPFWNCNVTIIQGTIALQNLLASVPLVPISMQTTLAKNNCTYAVVNKKYISTCNNLPSNDTDYFYYGCSLLNGTTYTCTYQAINQQVVSCKMNFYIQTNGNWEVTCPTGIPVNTTDNLFSNCRANSSMNFYMTCDNTVVAKSCINSQDAKKNYISTCAGFPLNNSLGGNNYSSCVQVSALNYTCNRIPPNATNFTYFISNGTNYANVTGYPYVNNSRNNYTSCIPVSTSNNFICNRFPYPALNYEFFQNNAGVFLATVDGIPTKPYPSNYSNCQVNNTGFTCEWAPQRSNNCTISLNTDNTTSAYCPLGLPKNNTNASYDNCQQAEYNKTTFNCTYTLRPKNTCSYTTDKTTGITLARCISVSPPQNLYYDGTYSNCKNVSATNWTCEWSPCNCTNIIVASIFRKLTTCQCASIPPVVTPITYLCANTTQPTDIFNSFSCNMTKNITVWQTCMDQNKTINQTANQITYRTNCSYPQVNNNFTNYTCVSKANGDKVYPNTFYDCNVVSQICISIFGPGNFYLDSNDQAGIRSMQACQFVPDNTTTNTYYNSSAILVGNLSALQVYRNNTPMQSCNFTTYTPNDTYSQIQATCTQRLRNDSSFQGDFSCVRFTPFATMITTYTCNVTSPCIGYWYNQTISVNSSNSTSSAPTTYNFAQQRFNCTTKQSTNSIYTFNCSDQMIPVGKNKYTAYSNCNRTKNDCRCKNTSTTIGMLGECVCNYKPNSTLFTKAVCMNDVTNLTNGDLLTYCNIDTPFCINYNFTFPNNTNQPRVNCSKPLLKNSVNVTYDCATLVDPYTNKSYTSCNITNKFYPECQCLMISSNTSDLNMTAGNCSCNYKPVDAFFTKYSCSAPFNSTVWAGQVQYNCTKNFTQCYVYNVTFANGTTTVGNATVVVNATQTRLNCSYVPPNTVYDLFYCTKQVNQQFNQVYQNCNYTRRTVPELNSCKYVFDKDQVYKVCDFEVIPKNNQNASYSCKPITIKHYLGDINAQECIVKGPEADSDVCSDILKIQKNKVVTNYTICKQEFEYELAVYANQTSNSSVLFYLNQYQTVVVIPKGPSSGITNLINAALLIVSIAFYILA